MLLRLTFGHRDMMVLPRDVVGDWGPSAHARTQQDCIAPLGLNCVAPRCWNMMAEFDLWEWETIMLKAKQG